MVLFVALVFCGEALAFAVCRLAGANPPGAAGVLALAVVAIVIGGVGAVLLNGLVLGPVAQMGREMADLRGGVAAQQDTARELASRMELQRRLRHDLRGALSPALLTADRLISHEDPRVRRAGEIMVKSVERAAALLDDPAERQPSPPGDP